MCRNRNSIFKHIIYLFKKISFVEFGTIYFTFCSLQKKRDRWLSDGSIRSMIQSSIWSTIQIKNFVGEFHRDLQGLRADNAGTLAGASWPSPSARRTRCSPPRPRSGPIRAPAWEADASSCGSRRRPPRLAADNIKLSIALPELCINCFS